MRLRSNGDVDKTTPAIFVLVGGVGNQLFVYFAGRAYEIATQRRVIFDTSQLGKGMSGHSSDIRDFKLPGTFTELGSNKFETFLRRAMLRIGKALGSGEVPARLSGIYDAPVDGFDPGIFSDSQSRVYRGYFQTEKYLQMVHPHKSQALLQLQKPSEWLNCLIAQSREKLPVIVHVRRGDYALLKESIGILSGEYFAGAIESARRHLLDPVREVWVFSDEPETAIREILEANPSLTNIRSIIPPPNVADVESIVAMATGAAIVISNSTFSWWAAMSSGSSLVFAPKKWFRGKPDPAYLYPDTWLLHEATWVE